MNNHCICEHAGFCKRHRINKTIREFELCKGVADTKDGGMKYWNAWEQGRLGATAPAEPVLNPDGFTKVRKTVQTRKPQLCEHLGKVIAEEPCTCGGKKTVSVFECKNDKAKHSRCLLTESDFNKLKDETLKTVLSVCQTCPLITLPQRTGGSPFRSRGSARFIKSSQLQEDIKTLIGKIPSDITAIAGVARSGMSVATMVSMALHLPLLTIRQTAGDIQPTGNGWRLGGSVHVDPVKDKVLVVDDTVMTGNSLRSILPIVDEQFKSYVTSAVYVNPLATTKPDIWAVDLPWPHLLEWNLFNSVLSPNMAVDFDGILCQDCRPDQDDDGERYLDFIQNAKPLYLPRKVPIPLIVTARIEKYRKPTEEWLKKYNIRYRQLIMHPARNLRERNQTDIAEYKATHFSNWAAQHKPSPPPLGFIESDDRQAQAIARKTGLMVISPHAGKVYQ